MEERKYGDNSSKLIMTKDYEKAGELILKMAKDEDQEKE